MGAIILLGVQLAILALVIFVPVIASLLIRLDYVLILLIVWGFVFGASGQNPDGLLAGHEIHTVFVILTYLAVCAAWFGLQRIRVLNLYIFRIGACAFSAYLFVEFATRGLFGQTIAGGMDTIWQWTIGIVCFAVTLVVRSAGSGVMLREQGPHFAT
jgi:hypothetical protein